MRRILLRTAFAGCVAGAVLDWILAFEPSPVVGLVIAGRAIALLVALGPLGLFLGTRDRWALSAALLLALRASTGLAVELTGPESAWLSVFSTTCGLLGWTLFARTLFRLKASLSRMTSILILLAVIAWALGWLAQEIGSELARICLGLSAALFVALGPLTGAALLGASLEASPPGRERGRRFLLAGAIGAVLIELSIWGLAELRDGVLIPMIAGAVLLVLGYLGIGRRGSRWGYAAVILVLLQLAIVPLASELLRHQARELTTMLSIGCAGVAMAVAHVRGARFGARWAAYGAAFFLAAGVILMVLIASRSMYGIDSFAQIALFCAAGLAAVHFSIAADGVLTPDR